MTSRATARHRAPVRPATPLSSLTSAVSEHVNTLGRGGVVIAMSSGLVATMGLPAQAVEKSAPVAATLAGGTTALAAPSALDSAAPLSAPATAKVTFEADVFTAVPAPAAPSRATAARTAGSQQSTGVRAELTTQAGSARGSSALSIAARYIGVPYVYGGTTPQGWDCSGATSYIFRQLGYTLPRTANDQMLATKRVSRSEARPGDLVFMLDGGRAYHVGIFAGGNMMYDSGRTGKSFSKREIWTTNVVFGRVG